MADYCSVNCRRCLCSYTATCMQCNFDYFRCELCDFTAFSAVKWIVLTLFKNIFRQIAVNLWISWFAYGLPKNFSIALYLANIFGRILHISGLIPKDYHEISAISIESHAISSAIVIKKSANPLPDDFKCTFLSFLLLLFSLSSHWSEALSYANFHVNAAVSTQSTLLRNNWQCALL